MTESNDPIASMNEWNRQIIEEFRANDGKVGGQFEGAPLLLLHTTGAKTGQERINPLMYQQLPNGDISVFASKAGAPSNPDWFRNVKANPRATVEVGAEKYEVEARIAEGDERNSIWEQQKSEYPGFAEYERQTSRQIPVVVLHRIH